MRIIAHRTLVVFYQKHTDAEIALEEWYDRVKNTDWNCFADAKNDFASVDSVGNKRYVFNIHGNKYRLVAIVLFGVKMIYIRFIGTHKEYDKIDDIKNI